MADIRTVQDIFTWKKTDFDGIRARIREAVEDVPAHDTLRTLLLECAENSGKMLRPLMILMAAEDYDGQQRDKLLWSAAAGELLHTASLLLDDIIDGADTRRGKPSVQARYGAPVALCAGNHLVATAYACLCDRGYTDVARDLMTVTQLVCDGEMLQDENRWNTEITEETYLRAVTGKTAAVFSFACEISSRISGHSERTQDTMRAFGETVGVMFQIRDDVLDWSMDGRKLGKPSGEDFINGIYTLPAICAFRSAEHGEALRGFAAKRQALSPPELAQVRRLVEASGGLDGARAAADRLADRARELLDSLSPSVYVSALRMFVRQLAP
ncbi:MAG: polyprenyl synthetase family protein [Ruminococcaceae bacterium]|nr:polyprenyl synthetase family protein [Oscillospiraceae bacterium]